MNLMIEWYNHFIQILEDTLVCLDKSFCQVYAAWFSPKTKKQVHNPWYTCPDIFNGTVQLNLPNIQFDTVSRINSTKKINRPPILALTFIGYVFFCRRVGAPRFINYHSMYRVCRPIFPFKNNHHSPCYVGVVFIPKCVARYANHRTPIN